MSSSKSRNRRRDKYSPAYEQMQTEVIQRRLSSDFFEALQRYDMGEISEAGPAGCDSDKCLLPLAKPNN